MRLIDNDRISALGQVADLLRHKGELLERGDDDGHARTEGLRQLRGVDVDLLHYALFMLELVDGVLQLLVQDHPVGHHDDRVEDLFVLLVVKARQAMGQPGDGVRFAAAGRVLDQVVGPGAMLSGIGHQFSHAIKLVIAREDHGLSSDLLAAELLLLDLQMHEPRQDVEEAMPFQDLFPQVGGLIASRVLGIAGAGAAAPG